MKKLFWNPSKISDRALAAVAGFTIVLAIALEFFAAHAQKPEFGLKVQAAQKVSRAFDLLRIERAKRTGEPQITLSQAPALLGLEDSPITSKHGDREAKARTLNPDWAAAFIDMFREAGLKKGDLVAVSISGSFPALNIAALVAAETYGLRPMLVSSVASSSFGANHPNFTWLDMESALVKNGLIKSGSLAASLGGVEDRGVNLDKNGRDLLKLAIERNHVTFLDAKSIGEAVTRRIELYKTHARGDKIAAYINVGGGIASWGTLRARKFYSPGINFAEDTEEAPAEGVMAYFRAENIPILQISWVKKLAAMYGIPKRPTMIGTSEVYFERTYSPALGVSTLLAVIGTLIYMSYKPRLRLSDGSGIGTKCFTNGG